MAFVSLVSHLVRIIHKAASAGHKLINAFCLAPVTTCMVSFVAILVWRLPVYLVIPIWLIFGALDGAFLSSVFEKVPEGAWFTLMLALILSTIFTLWRFGKESQWRAESLDQLSPRCLFNIDDSTDSDANQVASPITLAATFGGVPVSTVPGLGIFFDKAGDLNHVPACFAHFVMKFAARPAVIVFFHMRPLPVPSVPLEERYIVTRMPGLAACYKVTLRHGYGDDVLHPGLARDLVGQIELAVSRSRRLGIAATELQSLRSAYGSQMVYVLGKETMKIRNLTPGPSFVWDLIRSGLLWSFLWIRDNTRTKLADLDIDADKLIEVGFLKEI